jgi:hypothetical protein
VRDPRVRWLVLFGASWCLQALSNGYYLLFFGLVVGLWILWFAPPWRNRKTSAAIVAAWTIASLPLMPLLWQYEVIHQRFRFARDFGTMVFFGADLMALLNAAPALSLWGHLHVFKRAEDELFPGITIAAVILAGVVLVRHMPVAPRSRGWWWARSALAMVGAISGAIALSILMIGPWDVQVARTCLAVGCESGKAGDVRARGRDSALADKWPRAQRVLATINSRFLRGGRISDLASQSRAIALVHGRPTDVSGALFAADVLTRL